jgi:hypothetical protein
MQKKSNGNQTDGDDDEDDDDNTDDFCEIPYSQAEESWRKPRIYNKQLFSHNPSVNIRNKFTSNGFYQKPYKYNDTSI